MTEQKEERRPVSCPYCDTGIMESNFPYCQACRVTIFYCPKCREPLSRDNKVCPHCGAEIKG